VVAACREPAQTEAQHPAKACPAIAARCDRAVTDDQVFHEVQARCWGCHGAGGPAGHDFVDLHALRAAPVGDMVGSCQMPPQGLPDPERQMLVTWAACPP
jgi:hypothetical protein